MYRSTPHSTTGVSPAEFLYYRKIRTKLPELDSNFNAVNMAWYGMERKFRYGIWKMPEWNERQSSILPYQFHTRFRTWHLEKNI